MKKINVLLVVLLSLSLSVYSQHEEKNHNKHEADAHFRISVAIAHTFLPEETAEGTQNIIIPMQGEIDSMNVSVSAAIVIFEALRQRRL